MPRYCEIFYFDFGTPAHQSECILFDTAAETLPCNPKAVKHLLGSSLLRARELVDFCTPILEANLLSYL